MGCRRIRTAMRRSPAMSTVNATCRSTSVNSWCSQLMIGCMHMHMHIHILKVWLISKIQLCRSMHIYLKNNCAKFHPNSISYNGALGFLKVINPTTRRRQLEKDWRRKTFFSYGRESTIFAAISIHSRCSGAASISGHTSFSQRTVKHWNALPDHDVSATSVNNFKNRLDSCEEWGNWKRKLLQPDTIKYRLSIKNKISSHITSAISYWSRNLK